jgi:hypothetical protein
MSGLKNPKNGWVRETVITRDGQNHPSDNYYPPRTLSFLKRTVEEKNQKDPGTRSGIEKYDAALDKWIWIYPKRID